MKVDGFKHLSKSLHNVCDLQLYDCGITTEEIEVLSQAISMLKDPVSILIDMLIISLQIMNHKLGGIMT